MEHGFRTRLVTAVVLVAVFGAGVLLGFAADPDLRAEPPEAVVETTGADGDGEVEAPATERRRLYHQVDPNEEQLARIDAIVKEHRERTNVLTEESRAQLRAGFRVILLETREAIKSELGTADK